jgi:hypothetical protein
MEELKILHSLREIFPSKQKVKMCLMGFWEEQQEELRVDRNQLDICQITCQMEIMFQIITMKDIHRLILNTMITYKDLRKGN